METSEIRETIRIYMIRGSVAWYCLGGINADQSPKTSSSLWVRGLAPHGTMQEEHVSTRIASYAIDARA
jgi:hypothetical protein